MKRLLTIATLLSLLLCHQHAMARDTKHLYPLQDALNTPAAQEKLTGKVQFFFGSKKPANIAKSMGSHTANKKTNAFNKTDKEACE